MGGSVFSAQTSNRMVYSDTALLWRKSGGRSCFNEDGVFSPCSLLAERERVCDIVIYDQIRGHSCLKPRPAWLLLSPLWLAFILQWRKIAVELTPQKGAILVMVAAQWCGFAERGFKTATTCTPPRWRRGEAVRRSSPIPPGGSPGVS